METDTTRRGLFWDMQEGRVPMPPCARTLGWELLGIDPEQGTIEVAFDTGDRFTNPVGVVQGGFLAAMLDDTMGPALVATLPEGQFAPTLELSVRFLRPALPGRIVGRGRVVKRGRSACFVAGELVDSTGEIVATATATALVQVMR